MRDVATSLGGLRVEATDLENGRRTVRLFALALDGAEELVVSWSEPGVGGHPDDGWEPEIAVARSPSGRRACVRIGVRTRTFDLATGRLVADDPGPACLRPGGYDGAGPGVVAAAGGSAVDPHDAEAGSESAEDEVGLEVDGILAWNAEDVASVRATSFARTTVATLAPGVEVSITGPVPDVPDGASSCSGTYGFAFLEGTTPDAIRRLKLEHRTATRRAAETPVRARTVVTVAGRDVVVQDVETTGRRGHQQTPWPVLAGPRGVLLRRVAVVSYPGHRAGATDEAIVAGPSPGTEEEVLTPWLVTPTGEVRTLPFELGNLPLATLPDGRFLLPCHQPMWWDGADEPLTALADDGRTTPLLLSGEPLTPRAAVRSVDPSLAPAGVRDAFDTDDAWRWTSAAVVDGGLVLALEPLEPEPGSAWVLLEVPLDGTTCGPPRRIASGTPPADTVARVVV